MTQKDLFLAIPVPGRGPAAFPGLRIRVPGFEARGVVGAGGICLPTRRNDRGGKGTLHDQWGACAPRVRCASPQFFSGFQFYSVLFHSNDFARIRDFFLFKGRALAALHPITSSLSVQCFFYEVTPSRTRISPSIISEMVKGG